jgi:hypothetical protein
MAPTHRPQGPRNNVQYPQVPHRLTAISLTYIRLLSSFASSGIALSAHPRTRGAIAPRACMSYGKLAARSATIKKRNRLHARRCILR